MRTSAIGTPASSADGLAAKVIALHAGAGENAAAGRRQALDPLGDGALHPGGQRVPCECLVRSPTPRLILEDLTAFLQAAQQLHGKERMAARLRIERIAKPRPQAIGLRIHICLDKRTPVCSVQIDHDLTLDAAQLIDSGCKRVALQLTAGFAGLLVAPAKRDGRRAVRAEDQQAAAAEFTADVRKKGRACLVHPLQIVEQKQKRLFACDRRQGADQLVKQCLTRLTT